MESDRFSELERLWTLKESGALTEDEFLRLKARALGTTAQPPTDEVGESEPIAAAAPEQTAAVSDLDKTTTKPQSYGCAAAVGFAFFVLVLLAIAKPSSDTNAGAGTSTENISVTDDEPSDALSPEHERRKEEKRRSEIAKLQQEVAAIPATDYDQNERLYARLAELQPSNEEFRRKRWDYAEKKRLAETYLTQPWKALQIARYNWSKGGFNSVQLVTLTVKNNASFPIRDFELKCVHQGPSGTDIDLNVRTVYERIPAHGSKYIPEVNMGFIHPQVATSRCEITDAVRS